MPNKFILKPIVRVLIALCGTSAWAQTVHTQYGPVEGTYNHPVVQFLGIPYAKPPVGENRWSAPLEPEVWVDAWPAHQFAPACPQKKYQTGQSGSTLEGDEDCLYLNIWTPDIEPASPKPVMVFIHGGGNQQGSTGELNGGTRMYFGKNLSERGDVVVVTLAYRLGPLGFLVHPGLEQENQTATSGNYGVMDQILALKWIRNNIGAFGGDAQNVMIFGESAGGLNVANLLTSPAARGLFHRAAIQSASPILNSYSNARLKGVEYANGFVAEGDDKAKIAHLRLLSADSLLYFESSPLEGGVVQMNWQPVIDQHIFPDTPMEVFQSGNFNQVPLLIGSNAQEMSLQVPTTVLPIMTTVLLQSIVPAALQPKAFSLYPSGSTPAEARKSMVNMLTDLQFTAPARRTAQCISMNQTHPVWRYLFNHTHTVTALEDYGAYHGMELFYLFNTWEEATLGSGPLFKPEDKAVQELMLQYWVNFAYSGNPNGSGMAAWPAFDASTDCYLRIEALPDGTQCGLRSAASDLWDQVAGYEGCVPYTGVETQTEDSACRIYPNPTSTGFHIQLQAPHTPVAINLYNALGQIVISTSNNYFIDLSNQPDGIYFLEIKTHLTSFRSKILKTR